LRKVKDEKTATKEQPGVIEGSQKWNYRTLKFRQKSITFEDPNDWCDFERHFLGSILKELSFHPILATQKSSVEALNVR
jgi:hypothetical protein